MDEIVNHIISNISKEGPAGERWCYLRRSEHKVKLGNQTLDYVSRQHRKNQSVSVLGEGMVDTVKKEMCHVRCIVLGQPVIFSVE